MKKILKYGIFILFIVMLHSLVMTAAKVSSSAPTTGHAEEVGSAQSMQTVLLRQFCYLYSHLACDAAHIDKCYTHSTKYSYALSMAIVLTSRNLFFHVIILLTPPYSAQRASRPTMYLG